MAESTNHGLSERIAVPEERMKTLQSGLHGTLERFRADTTDWKSDMARRDRDSLCLDGRIRDRPDRGDDHRPGRGLCAPGPGNSPAACAAGDGAGATYRRSPTARDS